MIASQLLKWLWLCALIVPLMVSCRRNPTACLDIPEFVEVKRSYTFKSCSENYAFLTWDFNDGSNGTVGDSAIHTFYDEGIYTLQLKAYARGAYHEDETSAQISAAYRYIDHLAVSGSINYNSLQFKFGNFESKTTGTAGDFDEVEPLEIAILPKDTVKILQQPVKITLNGLSGSIPYQMLDAKVNFENNVDNPVILENEGYKLKIYWKYIARY